MLLVHLTMGDILHTVTFSSNDWFQDMQRALDAVAWAVHTSVNLQSNIHPVILPSIMR